MNFDELLGISMKKKVSELEKYECGIIESIYGFKNELECMGIAVGTEIKSISGRYEKITVISLSNKKDEKNEIVLLNDVASEILVKTSEP